MRSLIFLTLVLFPTLGQAEAVYYDKPAILDGQLLKIKSLHPNLEAFGGNQIAIALDRVIKVDGNGGLVRTKLIQLVDIDEKRYKELFNKDGKPVRVVCNELFRAHTAHHTTKVLCVVKSIVFK